VVSQSWVRRPRGPIMSHYDDDEDDEPEATDFDLPDIDDEDDFPDDTDEDDDE
jgi:hypothetical protein